LVSFHLYAFSQVVFVQPYKTTSSLHVDELDPLTSQASGTLASDEIPWRHAIDHGAFIVVREETWGLFVVRFQSRKREGLQEVAALTFVLKRRMMGGFNSCDVVSGQHA